jgi:hypothetical protein
MFFDSSEICIIIITSSPWAAFNILRYCVQTLQAWHKFEDYFLQKLRERIWRKPITEQNSLQTWLDPLTVWPTVRHKCSLRLLDFQHFPIVQEDCWETFEIGPFIITKMMTQKRSKNIQQQYKHWDNEI